MREAMLINSAIRLRGNGGELGLPRRSAPVY